MQPGSPAEGRRPLAYVALYHGIDAERFKREVAAGRNLDATPYGFHHAEEFGFDVVFASDAPRNPRVARFLDRLLGFDLLHAWSNRRRAAQADVIWTITEGEGFAIACLMALGLLPRRPIVCNVVWLLNNWQRGKFYKRIFYRRLARGISILSVHSERCLEVARRVLPQVRSELMYFGVSTETFRPREAGGSPPGAPLHVISLGSDKTRDWQILFDAFGNDDRFRLSVVCWRLSEADVAPYANVTLCRPQLRTDYLALYRSADFAVVPMRENIFSGITSALDAVASGVPLIASRTGGLPTYFDEDQVFYVPVGDAAALRAATEAPPEERSRRVARAWQRFQERDYSTRGLAGRYAAASRGLLPAPAGAAQG